jgi:hypothetical protein
MFAGSPVDGIPRMRQAGGANKTMITLFFTPRKVIVLDVLTKGHKYNQQSFVDYIFPDLEKANLSFHPRMPESTSWVHMETSIELSNQKRESRATGITH